MVHPPYSANVKTNVGAKFLRLIDKHFPPGSQLYPLLNRNSVKLSYRCLPNVGMQIAQHNSKILKKTNNQEKPEDSCNCQIKDECPLPGKCTTAQVIYQATVTTQNTKETYIGLTCRTFKERFYSHNSDFTHEDQKTSTTLSTHIWNLKESGLTPQINWKIIGHATPYSPVTKVCQLCTAEKYNIIFNPHLCSLNSRHELFSSCRHKRRLLLVKPIKKRKGKGKQKRRRGS